MNSIPKKSALICIDLVNEMVSKGGKLAAKGYLSFVEENDTLNKVKSLQKKFRDNNLDIFHVKISFSENYIEHPGNSPLFGKAREFKALQANSWGTEFAEDVKPMTEEKTIVKRRVSAFYATDLEIALRSRGVDTIFLAGVSTDLAIESAARDGHDRDFNIVVMADCCAAANKNDHSKSLETLQKISKILTLDELINSPLT